MTLNRFLTYLMIARFWLYGNVALAGRGCCSSHGGVAGCAGSKLQCNDGTVSPTCSCQDGVASPTSPGHDGVAFLGATPPEAKPYVTPIPEPSSANTVDAIPTQKPSQPYVNPVGESKIPSPADQVIPQEPITHHTSDAKQSGEETDSASSERRPVITQDGTEIPIPGDYVA